jgi:hypothetical protein
MSKKTSEQTMNDESQSEQGLRTQGNVTASLDNRICVEHEEQRERRIYKLFCLPEQ